MTTIRKTKELIQAAQNILARHGFHNATVFRSKKNNHAGSPILYTTTDLNGVEGSEATDEIVLKLGVQFDGEGTQGGFF